jgi:hypothetical protein
MKQKNLDRNQIQKVLKFVLALFAWTLLPGPNSFASLGGTLNSIEVDQKTLSAKKPTIKNQKTYFVHEFDSDGTSIREYVLESGTVFGIAWSGLTHPDLDLLLGKYSKEYTDELQRKPRTRGSKTLFLKTHRIVVQKWGHMRNLQGRAYIPTLLPPGMTENDIK